MSDNNNAALAVFAECDSLFQSLSTTDESAISGGRRHKKTNKGNKPRHSNRRARLRRRRRNEPPIDFVPGGPLEVDFPDAMDPTFQPIC